MALVIVVNTFRQFTVKFNGSTRIACNGRVGSCVSSIKEGIHAVCRPGCTTAGGSCYYSSGCSATSASISTDSVLRGNVVDGCSPQQQPQRRTLYGQSLKLNLLR